VVRGSGLEVNNTSIKRKAKTSKNVWVSNPSHIARPNTMEHVLSEKLVVAQLVKKFTAFYGDRKFITIMTRPRQLLPFLCFLTEHHAVKAY